MRKLKSILLVMVLLFSAMSLSACGAEGKVTAVIEDFEKACSTADAEGIIDCLNPTVADTINAAFGILGMFADVDKEEVLDKVTEVLLSGLGNIEGGSEFFTSVDIEIEEVTVEGTTGLATGTFHCVIDGEEKTLPVQFTCGENDETGEWYISEISFE